MGKIVVLFNPSSDKGRSLKKKSKVEKYLKENRIDYDLFVSKSEDDLVRLSIEATGNYSTIVGVGGDTTFNIIVSAILKSKEKKVASLNPVFGMIGTGSANDIVQSLSIQKIETACKAIKFGNIKKMDVGYINIKGRDESFLFLGTLSAGLSTYVNLFIESFIKNHKFLAKSNLISQTLTGLVSIKKSFSNKIIPLRICLENGDIKRDIECSLIVFHNAPCYANGMKLNPFASPFNRKVDCSVVNTTSFLNTFNFGMKVLRSRHIKRKEIEFVESKLFRVFSEKEIDILVDGDIIRKVKEFEISVFPGALNVLTYV